jgi:hypothetical protein
MTQVGQNRTRQAPLRARPVPTEPESTQTTATPPPADERGPGRRVSDLFLRQGAPDSTEVVAPWRPAAAGGVIAAGGAIALIVALIGTDLINIVLIAGLTLLIAGFVDGTGRRYRGTGVGLTIVGIVPRLFDSASWLQEGWIFGLFLLAYGAYIVVSRQRHPEAASR